MTPSADLVVAFKGGLGNQLFQWAFSLGLHGETTRVRYDAGLIRRPLTYELDRLVPASRLTRAPSLSRRALSRVGLERLSPWRTVPERTFRHDPQLVAGLRGRCLLEGYWQSPRYFAGHERAVAGALTPWAQDELTEEGQALLRRISASADACSIHVRRGDYVSNPTASAHHGVLDADYYRRAARAAADSGAKRFFVFTNDPDWVRADLDLPGAFVVPHTVARSPIGEIGLMAACTHHVVANSSFSWWGAWLGEHADGAPDERRGTTVAPERWFADASIDTTDLLPAHWLRVQN